MTRAGGRGGGAGGARAPPVFERNTLKFTQKFTVDDAFLYIVHPLFLAPCARPVYQYHLQNKFHKFQEMLRQNFEKRKLQGNSKQGIQKNLVLNIINQSTNEII